jgi:hypothetical protein
MVSNSDSDSAWLAAALVEPTARVLQRLLQHR